MYPNFVLPSNILKFITVKLVFCEIFNQLFKLLTGFSPSILTSNQSKGIFLMNH